MATTTTSDDTVTEFAGQLFFRLWRVPHTRTAEALGSLGLTTALFGLLAGTAVAAMIVTEIMRLPFAFLIGNAALAALLAVLVSVGLGLVGTFRILSQKPAPYLRNL